MNPAVARRLLLDDAEFQKNECLSATEWEERVKEEKLLREAEVAAGPGVVNAISRMVWGWDRPTTKLRRV